MKPPRPHQPEPVTAERIERALDGLAQIMVDAGAAGRVYLPIYQRLERELEVMRKADEAMATVHARAARARRKVMTNYVAILDGEGSTWGIRFPDFPGCVGGGSSPEEAISNATVALRDTIAFKADDGFAVPSPTSLADILASGEVRPGEAVVVVSPAK